MSPVGASLLPVAVFPPGTASVLRSCTVLPPSVGSRTCLPSNCSAPLALLHSEQSVSEERFYKLRTSMFDRLYCVTPGLCKILVKRPCHGLIVSMSAELGSCSFQKPASHLRNGCSIN